MLAFLVGAMVLMQPAKASKLEKAATSSLLLQPVKAFILLSLLLQPAKAPPPGRRHPRPYLPWWRVRMDRAGDFCLCYPSGFFRELDQEEVDEIESWMDDSAAIENYINYQSNWCDQNGDWNIPYQHPVWSTASEGYVFPGFDHGQAAGNWDYYTQWEQQSGHWVLVCMAEEQKHAQPGNGSHYSAASSSQPARGYSKGYGDQQPAKSYSKGHGDQQPAKGYSKGYGDQQPAKGSKKGPQPGKLW